jgi:hypothetical protein
MAKVWLYVVAASNDPDSVRCVVPWQVDRDLVFFGPCKKRIRERLRRQFLRGSKSHATVTERLFIVGVNAGNSQRIRKIVWLGRVAEVMTFAEATARLRGGRFQELLDHPASPLHVRPLLEKNKLVGYEHVSDEHIQNDAWISDLVTGSGRHRVRVDGRKLVLLQGSSAEAFDRDCCLLLENRFFAHGKGIELDDHAMRILRDAQPDRRGIDGYAVFGLTASGEANGLRGTFLEMAGQVADRFVEWLEHCSMETCVRGGYVSYVSATKGCG